MSKLKMKMKMKTKTGNRMAFLLYSTGFVVAWWAQCSHSLWCSWLRLVPVVTLLHILVLVDTYRGYLHTACSYHHGRLFFSYFFGHLLQNMVSVQAVFRPSHTLMTILRADPCICTSSTKQKNLELTLKITFLFPTISPTSLFIYLESLASYNPQTIIARRARNHGMRFKTKN